MSPQFDQDRVKRHIAESLGKIHAEADPALLDQYRKLIGKEVSFFKRSYLAAYLLMEWDQKGGGKRYGGGRDGRSCRETHANTSRKYENGADGEAREGRKAERTDYPLADEDSLKLFFSAGRSRRAFPREILGLIISRTQVAKEDIGAIKILDNYSFVQVRTTVADSIISALDGVMFRGKPLVVNYARAGQNAGAASGEEGRETGGVSGGASDEDDGGDTKGV
jgi:hypothetical protein